MEVVQSALTVRAGTNVKKEAQLSLKFVGSDFTDQQLNLTSAACVQKEQFNLKEVAKTT